MTVPPMPYRCPPAPYERVELIAWWLKTRNIKGRLVVLDPNLPVIGFDRIFRDTYRDQITYLPQAGMKSLDPFKRRIVTDFDTIDFSDAILMPPQQAGEADLDWARRHFAELFDAGRSPTTTVIQCRAQMLVDPSDLTSRVLNSSHRTSRSPLMLSSIVHAVSQVGFDNSLPGTPRGRPGAAIPGTAKAGRSRPPAGRPRHVRQTAAGSADGEKNEKEARRGSWRSGKMRRLGYKARPCSRRPAHPAPA